MARRTRLITIRLQRGPYAGLEMKLDAAPEIIGFGSPVARYERVRVGRGIAEYRFSGTYSPTRAGKVLTRARKWKASVR